MVVLSDTAFVKTLADKDNGRNLLSSGVNGATGPGLREQERRRKQQERKLAKALRKGKDNGKD